MKSLCALIMVVILTGCQGIQTYEKGNLISLGIGGLTGTTAYALADNLSDEDRALVAGGSGVAAYLLSEFVRGQIKADDIKLFNDGYDLGRSDAVKAQYWAIQNLQKPMNNVPQTKSRYYTFPGKTNQNGINYAPHEVKVRMEE